MQASAKCRDARASLAQGRHIGRVRYAEIGTHSICCPLHRCNVLFFEQCHHKISVRVDTPFASRQFGQATCDIGEHVERTLWFVAYTHQSVI